MKPNQPNCKSGRCRKPTHKLSDSHEPRRPRIAHVRIPDVEYHPHPHPEREKHTLWIILLLIVLTAFALVTQRLVAKIDAQGEVIDAQEEVIDEMTDQLNKSSEELQRRGAILDAFGGGYI